MRSPVTVIIIFTLGRRTLNPSGFKQIIRRKWNFFFDG